MILTNFLKTQSEEIKVSAAIGLGLTAAGNLIEILPILLNNLTSDDSQRNYLTLTSIRQATAECEIDTLKKIAPDLFERLQEFAGFILTFVCQNLTSNRSSRFFEKITILRSI